MSEKQKDFWGALLAILTGLGMLMGAILWLGSIDAKASQASDGVKELRAFQDEVIDRLARIEQNTNTLVNKKTKGD